jgi:hypothetical protein
MALVKSTPKQRAASRANGAKSKGPKTAEGKAASAANACTHHLYANKLGLSPAWARFATQRALVKSEPVTDFGERLLVFNLWMAQAYFEHAQRTLWACRQAAALELRANAKTVDHWLATQQKLLKSLCNHHRCASIRVQDAIGQLNAYRAQALFSGTTTNPQLHENKTTPTAAAAASRPQSPAPHPLAALPFHLMSRCASIGLSTAPTSRPQSPAPHPLAALPFHLMSRCASIEPPTAPNPRPQSPAPHPLAALPFHLMSRCASIGLSTAPTSRPALSSQTTTNPQLYEKKPTSHLLQLPILSQLYT